MKDMKSIVTVVEYGRIHLNLKQIMDSKGINRNMLSVVSGTRFEVINKWYNDDVGRMDLDILARICYVLDCSPEDIISYERPEEK